MSTPNFCRYEASGYYAIGVSEETYNDEFLYEDTKANVFYELKQLCKDKGYDFVERDKNRMYHDLFNRSYGGTYICSITKSKYIADIEITVNIHAVLSGGYYSGAILDYISQIEINGDDRNDIEEFEKYFEYTDLEYCSNLPLGMLKIQSKNILKFSHSAYKELTEQIEQIYSQYCEEKLHCVGIFSNGEAIYEKVS